MPGVMFASEPGQKPLTKREREVLNFISEGCSNKEGALRMRISPRTFESHRAEAMRKLGARNTADLVRTALLLYMGEIKQHSHQLTQTDGNRAYLQQVVENALQQTERVCAMMKQIAGTQEEAVVVPGRATGWEVRLSLIHI